ncbi:MAG: helix-turn-helix domain-containing protein [Deltaproteobacteria bacterium]|nr:helix-turn-helix domain-containing protein [Deltaproteobacteria bacterium]
MNRDFKGIWIPKEVWLDNDLTIHEKVFLVEIDSLDMEKGCYASNQYFANFFNISTKRASTIINALVKKKYIKSKIKYKKGTKQILKRVLNIADRPYGTKRPYPMEQNVLDNNTDTSSKEEVYCYSHNEIKEESSLPEAKDSVTMITIAIAKLEQNHKNVMECYNSVKHKGLEDPDFKYWEERIIKIETELSELLQKRSTYGK